MLGNYRVEPHPTGLRIEAPPYSSVERIIAESIVIEVQEQIDWTSTRNHIPRLSTAGACEGSPMVIFAKQDNSGPRPRVRVYAYAVYTPGHVFGFLDECVTLGQRTVLLAVKPHMVDDEVPFGLHILVR